MPHDFSSPSHAMRPRLKLFDRIISLKKAGLHLLLPPLCVGCGQQLEALHSLCVGCWLEVTLIEEPISSLSGLPLRYADADLVEPVRAPSDMPFRWKALRAAVVYNERAAQLVHDFKYHDRFEAGYFMARLMARACAPLLAKADWVIPIPLYRWRLWRRRFNQAAFLAQHLAHGRYAAYQPDLLQRVRDTSSQVGLGRKSRLKNLKKAFQVPVHLRPQLEGRRVLLIDDVVTTGATAAAATEALLAAGAFEVTVGCFALVAAPSSPHIGGER